MNSCNYSIFLLATADKNRNTKKVSKKECRLIMTHHNNFLKFERKRRQSRQRKWGNTIDQEIEIIQASHLVNDSTGPTAVCARRETKKTAAEKKFGR